ncbi:TIGR03943 family protein [Fontibacillus panacisegetis]|uniref:TIGR03943 family protein n=1 Tax=Fontibacillus panacisegetis TaxID=670482 RepID=A0A1G7Q0L7_9BACL|nr:TIGR03943 family protein [Fontibacillus panacisegetis]SDF92045.1 TIGR03943 family protein [Fontibacillus panacisegetis]
MNRPHIIRRHYFTRSLILLGFALYIGYLSRSDSLHYYIAPDMITWITYSTIPLTIMSLSLAYQALFHKEDKLCDCERPLSQSSFKNISMYGLFLFPLLLGILLPDQALGSMAAAKKGMTLGSPVLSSVQLSSMFKAPDKYNTEFAEIAKIIYQQQVIEVNPEVYSEIIGAIELFKDQFVGKEIKISGFVYEDHSLKQNHEFILGRFLVQCCTADANPFGVLITSNQSIASLQKDSWIEVQGVLRTEIRKGKEIIAISADQITQIPRPDTPYVYPNGDAIKGLYDAGYNIKSGTD